MRRSDFFRVQEQAITFRIVLGKDTANAVPVFQEVQSAQVVFGGQSLPAAAATVPEGTIRVFLRSVPVGLEPGDKIAVGHTRELGDFIYTISMIDPKADGTRVGKRYPVRIEAKRKV